MDLQVVLPDEDPAMPVAQIVELAVTAERLGFQGVWLPDHLLPPSAYGDVYGGVYEPVVTLTYLAAATTTIRLGTSVLILPLRDPFLLAKQAATLAHLSGDRLTLGVGIGWEASEFAAVGVDFTERGARTDEAITLLRHLFEGAGPFVGRFHRNESGVFAPVPRHPIPIMIGGVTPRALRRVASYADEWQGLGLSPEKFAAHVATIRSSTDRPIRVGTRIEWDGTAQLDQVVAEVRGFEAAGADAVAVKCGAPESFADRMAELVAAYRKS
ncbi:putative F420-dependent oxidoreductase [Nakamurella sp. UYEF19]|uniref:TIGR03619 family F420-dependent LLM class oxidoreductase n=1 Tax=Nakamurella sp. UYEF19 TaxID=1756392 RepID=UPI003395705D